MPLVPPAPYSAIGSRAWPQARFQSSRGLLSAARTTSHCRVEPTPQYAPNAPLEEEHGRGRNTSANPWGCVRWGEDDAGGATPDRERSAPRRRHMGRPALRPADLDG